MRIEKAGKKDLSFILPLFIRARKFMQENGNASQWAGAYPAREDIEKDIENGVAYVITEEALRENPLEEMHSKEEASSKEKRIVAYFAFIIGEEQTYKRIVEGRWSSDKEYGTIHRLVSFPIAGESLYGTEAAEMLLTYWQNRRGKHGENAGREEGRLY